MRKVPTKLLRVQYATESHCSGAVHAGGDQQQLAMLVQLIRLRKVPDRALRLIVAAAAQNAAARVLIGKLLSPLPHISYQVHHAEGTGSLRMGIDSIRASHGARLVGYGHRTVIPLVAPGIQAAICALGSVLPLPLVGQALSSPTRIGARVLLGDPRHRLVLPSLRVSSVLPIAEKIQIIFGMIVAGVEEFLEFGIRDRVLVDIERLDLQRMFVKAPR